jgi:hypothetical protein
MGNGRWMVAKEVMAADAGWSMAEGEVRSLRVNVEAHVAGNVSDNGRRVCVTIVQEFGDGFSSGMGAFGLDGCSGAESCEKSVINGLGIEVSLERTKDDDRSAGANGDELGTLGDVWGTLGAGTTLEMCGAPLELVQCWGRQ